MFITHLSSSQKSILKQTKCDPKTEDLLLTVKRKQIRLHRCYFIAKP